MNFGEAIAALKQGKKVKRAAWLGYWYMSEFLGTPTIVAKLRHNEGYAPAQPYQADLLADDWQVIQGSTAGFTVKDLSLQHLLERLSELRKRLYSMSPNHDEFLILADECKAVTEQVDTIRRALGDLQWQPCV